LAAAVFAAASYLPHVLAGNAGDGFLAGQIAEFADFLLAGLIVGFLADRDRKQKRALERTTKELAEVYRELQDNFDRMKRAERLYALGQLSAGLAHEIRNPLASISGATGILKRGQAPEQQKAECLGIIDRECERLKTLLTNFLEFARPRPPRYQPIAPAALLESVAALSAHAAGGRPIAVRQEIAPNLPALQSDAEQLKQVLLNLLINAMQAMPDGGEIVLAARSQADRLRIDVRDQGCGITPENIDRIFDPFFTTKEHGTGLGLSVAHQIVSQLGGILSAERNEGAGMTFSVQLPWGRARAQ
jgi:signal transduction histidine kinase